MIIIQSLVCPDYYQCAHCEIEKAAISNRISRNKGRSESGELSTLVLEPDERQRDCCRRELRILYRTDPSSWPHVGVEVEGIAGLSFTIRRTRGRGTFDGGRRLCWKILEVGGLGVVIRVMVSGWCPLKVYKQGSDDRAQMRGDNL